MVLITLMMTGIIVLLVSLIYRPSRRIVSYKRRTIQTAKRDSELRILVCVHTPRNVPTIIHLLQASNPTKKSPICVYVLHLLELTGAINRTQYQSDHIISAFENFEQHAGGVSVQPLTAISPYNTVHEDICNLAKDKGVAFIIIPFHKQQTVDGGMEPTNMAFRTINQNLLANSPCSVGILVDLGLAGANRLTSSQITHHVMVLFFGGPDDREALSYAGRMLDHPGIHLTVIRFVPGEEAMEQHSGANKEKEKQLDKHVLKEFRSKGEHGDSLEYMEKAVNNGEETVAAIRSMDDIHNLFIVGRGQGIITPLTAGLTDWSECPELGAIGDLLGSSDFAATASVLVVQQYIGSFGDALTTQEHLPHEEYRHHHHDHLSPLNRLQTSAFRSDSTSL